MREVHHSEIEVGTETASQAWPNQLWLNEDGEFEERAPLQPDYEYGNPDWPISKYRDLICDTVANNLVTVIASGTGNGKSIMVPQMLYETGQYGRIYQTQPQIIATRENAEFTKTQIRQFTGRDGNEILAYRTATEGDEIKPHHVIREHTDGYLLARELGFEPGDVDALNEQDVVIIDEAHMRNPNIDVAIALFLERGVRLVIQSASIDTQKWANYAAGVTGEQVPVLDLPGMMYPVQKIQGGVAHEEIAKIANQDPDFNPNIGIVVPGKHDAEEIHSKIARRIPKDYTILHLHKDMTPEQQQRVMHEYPGGKIIIATDVMRQSITIPDMHYVLEPGYQKQGDWRLGVQYLRVIKVPMDGRVQLSGRVGRTMPGTSVDVELEGYPKILRDSEGNPLVDEYSTPPIQRSNPANYVLKLLGVGRELNSLPLQDKVRSDEIEYAKRKLESLGAKALNSFAITEVGKEMLRLRLDPHFARMLVESRQYGRAVELQTAAMLYACQQEGITMAEAHSERWRLLTNETKSDMLAQLDVFTAAMQFDYKRMQSFNILPARFYKARTMLRQFAKDYKFDIDTLEAPNAEQREQILGSIIAGADMLFVSRGSTYSNEEGFEGRLAKSSVVGGQNRLIVGSPLVLEHYRSERLKSHSVITNATAVTPELLEKYAPNRCSYDNDKLVLNNHGQVVKMSATYFDGKPIQHESIKPAEPSYETTQVLLQELLHGNDTRGTKTERLREIRGEIARIRRLLVHESNRKDDFESIMKSVEQTVTQWKDVKVKNMHELANVLHKRQVHEWLQNTLMEESFETKAIMDSAPKNLLVETDSGIVMVEVEYENNKAFILAPPHAIANLQSVAGELGERNIYVWSDSAKKNYIGLDKAIERARGGNREERRHGTRSRRQRRGRPQY